MSWWVTIIGGVLGFIIGEGSLPSLLLGILIGNLIDRRLKGKSLKDILRGRGKNKEKTQSAFFTATFSMMGHIAKADGQVSRLEIMVAQDVMKEMRLNSKQRKVAIQLFDQGKKSDFPVDDVLMQFKEECHHRDNLVQMFLEILAVTALADGRLTEAQNRILRKALKILGLSTQEYQALLRRMRLNNPYRKKKGVLLGSDAIKLAKAYQLLEADETLDDDKLKRAYRRQMNRHHPDKLVSKGYSKEKIDIANQKAQAIKSAYEFIKGSRKSEGF